MLGLNFIEKGGMKNSFFTQYLSLILIILVFTVGAFLRGPKEVVKIAPLAEESAERNLSQNGDNERDVSGDSSLRASLSLNKGNGIKVEGGAQKIIRKTVSETAYDSLVNISSGHIDKPTIETFKILLQNHNLDMEVSFYPQDDSESAYLKSLQSAELLTEYLEQAGLPPSSWRVFSESSPNLKQARIRLVEFKEAE